MSTTLERVLDAARAGDPPSAIATRLGMSRGLVDAMLAQGERLGRLDVLRVTGCGGGACDPDASVACAACPIRPTGGPSTRTGRPRVPTGPDRIRRRAS